VPLPDSCTAANTDDVPEQRANPPGWQEAIADGPKDPLAPHLELWQKRPISLFLSQTTMNKGEATRRRIVTRTADLLNTQGYRGTPVSEIMRVAGLQKGGIYRHFESRAALTLEAFEYAVARMRDRLAGALDTKKTATDKLSALFEVVRNFPDEQAFFGGCPIMNLAVESDDADPKLRNAARKAMTGLIGLVERVIVQGMNQGDFPKGNARARATAIVASLEGGIMLSNLYKDRAYIEDVLDHLTQSLRTGFP
jgi:TetR/AcrR family transcriptional regulator, transcriptional repressor for nem operon